MKNLVQTFFRSFKSMPLQVGLFVIGLLSLAVTLEAQAPASFSYQAVIRNLSNEPITNTTVGVRITILRGSAAGSQIFQETYSPVTNEAGLISLEIGMGNTVFGDLGAIDWDNGPYFIEQAIDPTGGTNYTITGTTQLLSVPYALYARNAGRAKSAAQADIANSLSAAAAGPFSIPLGTILPFAGPASKVPQGWLLCDGTSYEIGAYQALFDLIGNTYGSESGRFRVPNLNGRAPVGTDGTQAEFNTLGQTGGAKVHTLTINEMPNHNHGGQTNETGAHNHTWEYPVSTSEGGNGTVSILGDDQLSPDCDAPECVQRWSITTDSKGAHMHTISPQGGGAAHNILQPYLVINYMIKAN